MKKIPEKTRISQSRQAGGALMRTARGDPVRRSSAVRTVPFAPRRAAQCRAVQCRGWTPALSAPRQPLRCCSAVASWKKRAGSLALPPTENKRRVRRRGRRGEREKKKSGIAAKTAQHRLVCICIEEPRSLAHLYRAAIMFCKNVTSRSS